MSSVTWLVVISLLVGACTIVIARNSVVVIKKQPSVELKNNVKEKVLVP